MIKEELYNLPKYYDVAFSWDLSLEIEFLKGLFNKYIPYDVKKIIEPACGTGRYLIQLPKCYESIKILGYDLSTDMINYTQEKIKEQGLSKYVSVIKGDMVSFKIEEKFDVAINMINSIGYLSNDEEIIKHLKNIGSSLRKGGLYIIQLNCAFSFLENVLPSNWEMEKDDISIKIEWIIEEENKEKKISYQKCIMDINDNGQEIKIIDNHDLRLWFYDDIKRLIEESDTFKLINIYDESFKEVNIDTQITGEMGNLYYILKVL